MAYKIRAVLAEDWELLRELRLAALADPVASVAFNETYELVALQDDEFWRRRAAQGTQGLLAETFIGEDEANGGRWAGSATVLDEGESAHVVGVYVRPAHRGTGLAEQLFQAAEDWSCERPYVQRMVLHVHEHNRRAEAFYRRIGFVRTGGFVSDPKAPVLKEFEMMRELPRRSAPRALPRSAVEGSS
ncbi:GNAT family N-acetyltransferase [Streptomyces bathyalis]|uniref:GNAT family N-acetyltransferase n=1 Tax=Streptomyces bathyalis TaxID=2710756 RepID=A0A7T1WSX9_9ACTN|nr:GNAT family N-acetyltransferase [Streptomyces bathyalis]QPP08004.1 GNAT family N-acetyltransferase [Streptomyces bathyalis]